MKAPLRSLLIGDVDYYPSEFIFGVNQGMTMLGHWHMTVNVRQDFGVLWQRVTQVQPDVIWGHMLLWAPGDKTAELLELCREAKRRWGTRVILHDGDARTETRYPHDVSSAVDLALCNHASDRSAWRIKCIRWPYFAFVQRAIANPTDAFACDLAFAGRMSASALYTERSEFVLALKHKLGDAFKIFTAAQGDDHTLLRTPEIAASANAVLGWGRPEAHGWTDVRVFQYPGAGGVLLHDDASEWLEPGVHYVPVPRGDADGVVQVVEAIKHGDMTRVRERAFAYVQREHSSLVRVKSALSALA